VICCSLTNFNVLVRLRACERRRRATLVKARCASSASVSFHYVKAPMGTPGESIHVRTFAGRSPDALPLTKARPSILAPSRGFGSHSWDPPRRYRLLLRNGDRAAAFGPGPQRSNRHHSALMFASRMTRPYFSYSFRRCTLKSPPQIPTG
jgi:hypothetical protein